MIPTEDMYFSADIEADGPIPGPYSMLAFGLVVAGVFDGVRVGRGVGDGPGVKVSVGGIGAGVVGGIVHCPVARRVNTAPLAVV